MTREKISRNDPCPCGSGKKFKHCCYGKEPDEIAPGLDEKQEASFGSFDLVDAKLKAIAKRHPKGAAWKGLVERLSDETSTDERIKTYQAVRQARVIPEEAGDFTILLVVQWMPLGVGSQGEGDEEVDDEVFNQEMERATLAQFRKFGADDLADRFVSNRLDFDRRHERGRQFFFGPPDEMLAKNLRARGAID